MPLLRRSRFVHLIPVAADRVLVADAFSHLRLVVDRALARFIQSFGEGRDVPESGPDTAMLNALLQRGILTDKTPEEELRHIIDLLQPYHGRDPAEMLARFRRAAKEGGEPYWAATATLTRKDFEAGGRRVDMVLLGDCDVHMESDFLRREALGRGIDLRVAAAFPDDFDFAGERRHDAVLIGAHRARHTITDAPAPGAAAHALFIAEMRRMLDGLRQQTAAPILIDNLPEPTLAPLGLAERGAAGHRNRFRAANLALAELAEAYADVHVVDVAAGFAAIGMERMLDDGYFGFTHFGAPGWLLQRPEKEKAAVHGIFPDLAPLAARLGDPYAREAAAARLHVDALMAVLALDRKKCVVVDLDGVLWPGVLAETGSPFAWAPNVSASFSYIGLYFGIQEALKALKRRGILLAAVSKNDEKVVRALWRYEDHYPRDLLLTPDDFVTWRVNWDDKAANIRAVADELGLDPASFLFIDDNPVERARVEQMLPQVECWGEDLFGLRRRLLSDPRLMVPRLTAEAASRTRMTRAQLGRQAARAASVSESEFLASLAVTVRVTRVTEAEPLARISELFARTTQFNANGAKFPESTLAALQRDPSTKIYAVHVSDRFGDHGLCGAAVVKADEIAGLVLSCRVLGFGVEHRFLQHILADNGPLWGRIIPTDRNTPVRNIYRDNGFTIDDEGLWRRG